MNAEDDVMLELRSAGRSGLAQVATEGRGNGVQGSEQRDVSTACLKK